ARRRTCSHRWGSTSGTRIRGRTPSPSSTAASRPRNKASASSTRVSAADLRASGRWPRRAEDLVTRTPRRQKRSAYELTHKRQTAIPGRSAGLLGAAGAPSGQGDWNEVRRPFVPDLAPGNISVLRGLSGYMAIALGRQESRV